MGDRLQETGGCLWPLTWSMLKVQHGLGGNSTCYLVDVAVPSLPQMDWDSGPGQGLFLVLIKLMIAHLPPEFVLHPHKGTVSQYNPVPAIHTTKLPSTSEANLYPIPYNPGHSPFPLKRLPSGLGKDYPGQEGNVFILRQLYPRFLLPLFCPDTPKHYASFP